MSKQPQVQKRPTAQKKTVKSLHQSATQELELFDDFTVLSISAEFNSRSIIYLTLAGTLVSTISSGTISQFFSLVVAFCLAYPTMMRYLSLPLRRRYPKQVGYTLILFDAFLIGVLLVVMGMPIMPSIFILIMANASFIAMGQALAYLLCLAFMATGAFATFYLLSDFKITEPPLMTSLIAGFGTGLYVAITAYYTNQSARRLKAARLEM